MEVVAPMPSASVSTVVIVKAGALSQSAQRVAHIPQQRFEERQSALIVDNFFRRLHGSELRAAWRRASTTTNRREIFGRLPHDVVFDLCPQALLGFRRLLAQAPSRLTNRLSDLISDPPLFITARIAR